MIWTTSQRNVFSQENIGKCKRKNICQTRLLQNLLTVRCYGVHQVTGNGEECTIYKDALNLHTSEIRKCERTFDKKLAIKNYTDKHNLQHDLNTSVKLSEIWQMLLNFGKCKCIHRGHGNMDKLYKMGVGCCDR